MPRFCSLGLVAAITIAWVASLIHGSGIAPIGLVSIGVGVALGASLVAIVAMLRVTPPPRRLLVVTLLLSFVTIAAQHTWLYLDFRRQWHEARADSPQVAMFRAEDPWSPAEYLAHEATPRQITLWCIDAALITAAAAITMRLAQSDKLSDSQPPAPSP